jgi:uncharacterized protein (TIGR00730 family)
MRVDNGKTGKVVAVYGSANTPPGTPDFDASYRLGKMLAEAGHAVMTGGYSGVMHGISQGAHEVGGRVIGVTVGMFKDRGLVPNPFLHEEVHLPSLSERLNYLIVMPDAYICLRGGAGTLSEMALAWSLLQVGEVPARPMVLVGKVWRNLVAQYAAESTLNANDVKLLSMVDSVEEVIPALASWWANPPNVPLRLGDTQKTPPLGDEV